MDPFSPDFGEPLGVVKCPKCGSQNFTARSNQYEILRTCIDCKNQWSGGSMAAAAKDPPPRPMIPGVAGPEEEDDVPVQFTGAPHRMVGDHDE